MYYVLDANGEPVEEPDVIAWGFWFENTANRVLAHDRDESGARDVFISTVFLGLDHSFGMGPAPVLWETMVFKGGGGHDVYCKRYSTRAEALAGHRRACAMANKGAFD